MKKALGYAIASAAVVAMMGFATGCGKVVEKASEKAMEKSIESSAKENGQDVKVDLDMKSGKMTIKGKDGTMEVSSDGEGKMVVKNEEGTMVMKGDKDSFEMQSEDGKTTMSTGANTKVPADFPKDVPVYDGLALQFASADTTENTFSVSGTTEDDVAKVADFYKKDLSGKGWTEETTLTQPDQQYLSFKKDNRMATIVISKGDDGTSVSITTLTEAE